MIEAKNLKREAHEPISKSSSHYAVNQRRSLSSLAPQLCNATVMRVAHHSGALGPLLAFTKRMFLRVPGSVFELKLG